MSKPSSGKWAHPYHYFRAFRTAERPGLAKLGGLMRALVPSIGIPVLSGHQPGNQLKPTTDDGQSQAWLMKRYCRSSVPKRRAGTATPDFPLACSPPRFPSQGSGWLPYRKIFLVGRGRGNVKRGVLRGADGSNADVIPQQSPSPHTTKPAAKVPFDGCQPTPRLRRVAAFAVTALACATPFVRGYLLGKAK